MTNNVHFHTKLNSNTPGGSDTPRVAVAARVSRVYHMVYEGVDKAGVHALGLATSKDGVKWERHSDQPIFERSPPGR